MNQIADSANQPPQAPQDPQGASAIVAAPAAPAVPPAPSSSPWLTALGRILRQPRFVVAALLIGVSGAALNGATQFMQWHFRKEAVPLPVKGLADAVEGIPPHLGRWVQVSEDEPLDPEMEQYLGTKQYVIRQYVDTQALLNISEFKGLSDPELRGRLAELKTLSSQERQGRLADLQKQAVSDDNPQVPVLTFQMTYYTGLVDTVAHIPERCYVADGFEPTNHDVVWVPGAGFADGKKGTKCDVPFRFISFEDQTAMGRVGRHVGYFFQVNGEYTEDPLTVREKLQTLLQRYGYYAKIELMAQNLDVKKLESDGYRHAVEKEMKEFVATSLPQIEKCLPDWRTVNSKAKAASTPASTPTSAPANPAAPAAPGIVK